MTEIFALIICGIFAAPSLIYLIPRGLPAEDRPAADPGQRAEPDDGEEDDVSEAKYRGRNRQPELPDLPPIWLLTRHEDVIRVSRDDAAFSSSTGNTFVAVPAGPDSAMLPSLDPAWLLERIGRDIAPLDVPKDRLREEAAGLLAQLR